MTATLAVGFEAWYTGFKQHADSRSFTSKGQEWTVSMARGECLDEAKTEVWRDVYEPTAIAMTFAGVDMGKLSALMSEPTFVEATSGEFNPSAPPAMLLPPSNLSGVPGEMEEGSSTPDMFIRMEVEDFDKWLAGFTANSDSKTGTWGYEVPVTRGEMCDDSKTRVFRSVDFPNRVAVAMYGIRMDVLQPCMAHESFRQLTADLGEKAETKVIRVIAALPAPAADVEPEPEAA
jgi:hypothetical protein